jgi:hypothetical protein
MNACAYTPKNDRGTNYLEVHSRTPSQTVLLELVDAFMKARPPLVISGSAPTS